jgi:23S rRNA (cytosine1962-C5)-methyltransferase
LTKPLRRALRRGHPWVYRDAVTRIDAAPGSVVTLVDEKGRFAARGWAEEGPIAVRVLTTVDEPVDGAMLERRLAAAARLRDDLATEATDCYRLVHGECDRLPGVVCDVYGRFATLQLDGKAAAARRDEVVLLLVPLLERRGVAGLLVRSGRRGERVVELAWGERPPAEVRVTEHGMTLCADLVAGQKTGLFLDHRESRRRVRGLAAGRHVLDLYAYVGGFSAAAGLGGAASVTTVDVAPKAIEHAARTWAENGLDPTAQRLVCADVPELLEAERRRGARYDLVVADPPSFAPSESARAGALRAYQQLHQACASLLAPGGLYLAASCSSHVDRAAFEDALLDGADKAHRILQVLDRWGAPPDHPRLLAFPESDYLTVALCRALD